MVAVGFVFHFRVFEDAVLDFEDGLIVELAEAELIVLELVALAEVQLVLAYLEDRFVVEVVLTLDLLLELLKRFEGTLSELADLPLEGDRVN